MHTYRTRESGPPLVGRHRDDVWTPIQALHWLQLIDNAKEISVEHLVLARDLCRSGQVWVAGIGRNANPSWPDAKIAEFERQVMGSAPLAVLITADEMAQLEFVIDRSPRAGPLSGWLIWDDTNIVAYELVEIGRTSFIRAFLAHRNRAQAMASTASSTAPVATPAAPLSGVSPIEAKETVEPIAAAAEKIFEQHKLEGRSLSRTEVLDRGIKKRWATKKVELRQAYRLVYETQPNHPPAGGWPLREPYCTRYRKSPDHENDNDNDPNDETQV